MSNAVTNIFHLCKKCFYFNRQIVIKMKCDCLYVKRTVMVFVNMVTDFLRHGMMCSHYKPAAFWDEAVGGI